MGMTIVQYRCRVGIHVSFVRLRDQTRRFEGEFWYTILMLFCRNVFYLPTLKFLSAQYARSNETLEWFNKMCYFHQVYVPLLLRLCSDIKKNQGPVTLYEIVDACKTVCSNFSQDNQIKFGENAGKQYVAMSLIAVVS